MMKRALTVGDVYQLITTEAKTIDENAPKQEAIEVMLSGASSAHSVYVINSIGKLRGVITIDDIIDSIAIRIGYIPKDLSLKTARKLLCCQPLALQVIVRHLYVTKESDLQTALKKMADNNLTDLPVVDEDGKIIGDLNAIEILKCIILE